MNLHYSGILMLNLFLLMGHLALFAQETPMGEKEILFSVDNEPVYMDEFNYIYKKNNEHNEDAFTKKDIDAYLELFINFKLKVREARNLGYDTTQSYKKELAQYMDQLTQPYLTEKKVSEDLVREAYERMQYELDVSHILVRIPANAAAKDTLPAYEKIYEIWNKAKSGEDFGDLAAQYSEEPMASQTRGHLGYFTALQMVYPFESAAYQTEAGRVSRPFRTQFGYHILKVHDRRLSQGKARASHIMLRFKPSMTHQDSTNLRDQIFEIHDLLVSGYEWDQMCKERSEDLNSRERGGSLSPFGVGEMIPEIVETVFALDSTGSISDPVMSPYGWHILKLDGRIALPSFEDYKDQLSRRIQRDSRSNKSKKVLIARLKKENEFSENQALKSTLFGFADSTTFSGDWQPVVDTPNGSKLFSMTDSTYSLTDFVNYVNINNKKAGTGHPTTKINKLYSDFAAEKLIEYEKAHLEEKYVDFRYLMKEYREGILLFEIMENEVWARSSRDSVGLLEFYNDNLEDYRTKEKATLVTFEFGNDISLTGLKELLTSMVSDTTITPGDVKDIVKEQYPGAELVKMGSFEAGSPEWMRWLPAGNGVKVDQGQGKREIILIKEYESGHLQELNQIKGLVISDYQDYLDQQWIGKLRENYKIEINKRALKKLYKSFEQ